MKSPKTLYGEKADTFLHVREQEQRDSLQVPSAFRDQRFSSHEQESGSTWTLSEPVELEGTTTFLPQSLSIKLLPLEGEQQQFLKINDRHIPYSIENVRKGIAHCLKISDHKSGGLEIVEHLYSLLGALRLRVGIEVKANRQMTFRNWLIKKLTGLGISMPSFAECNGPFLDAIANAGMVKTSTVLERVSVPKTIAMHFPHGGFIALEAHKSGNPHKLLRNRINYPDIPSVGSLEMQMPLDPATYAYLSTARPPAMNNWRTRWLLSQDHERIPLTNLSEENVVLVDETGIKNPKEKFKHQDFNWEYLGHEMVDKYFPWAYLEMVLGINLAGTWTCYAVSHAQELEFMKVVYQFLIQQEAVQGASRQSSTTGLGSPSAPLVEH